MKQTKPCLQGSLSGPRSVYTYVCLGICVMWLTLCRQVASKRIRDGCSLGISQLNSICHYSKGGSEGTGLRGQTVGAITIAPVAQTQVPHPLSSCLQPASPVRSEHSAEDTGSSSTQHRSLHTQQVLKRIFANDK